METECFPNTGHSHADVFERPVLLERQVIFVQRSGYGVEKGRQHLRFSSAHRVLEAWSFVSRGTLKWGAAYMAGNICSTGKILQAVWMLDAPDCRVSPLLFTSAFSDWISWILWIWDLLSAEPFLLEGMDTILSFCIENSRQASGIFFCVEKNGLLLWTSTSGVSDCQQHSKELRLLLSLSSFNRTSSRHIASSWK